MASSNAVARRQTGEVATADAHPLVQFRHQLEQRATEFQAALPSHISPEKFQRTVITAVQTDPDLLMADRQSLITSCMKAAQDGLLPDKREAALVIFKVNQKDRAGNWTQRSMAQYMPMVFGLRKKILQSGEIKDIQTNVVYRQEIEAGLFIYEEGTERMLRHKPLLDPGFDPTDDDIAAAYSVATFNDGTMTFEVMRRSEINKVREKSQTGALFDKKGKPRTPSGPWVDWFSEMARKTVMRRHSKTLPMSGDIIDIEAMDAAAASRSAVGLLSAVDGAEPEPLTLPSTQDGPTIDAQAQEKVDPQTGEVLDDQADEAGQVEEDAGMPGDKPTLEEARDYIIRAKDQDAVNSRLAEVLNHFRYLEDKDELKLVAAERIDELVRAEAE